jgi:hypothetical protein
MIVFVMDSKWKRLRLVNHQLIDFYSKDCPVGDDEHGCTNECPSKSICPANLDVSCIQHTAAGQLCRCTKGGYRLTTNLLQNNKQICQG